MAPTDAGPFLTVPQVAEELATSEVQVIAMHPGRLHAGTSTPPLVSVVPVGDIAVTMTRGASDLVRWFAAAIVLSVAAMGCGADASNEATLSPTTGRSSADS